MFGSKPTFGTTGFGTQTGGGFGTTSLFGSQTPSTGGLFGTTTTQSGGLFGSGTSTFGQNTLGGGFGSQQPTGLFGSSGQQTSSLFSTPASATNTGFGAKAPGSTGFGTNVQGSNAFGTPGGSTSSLFGSNNPSGSSTTGSLFGSATTSSAFTAQTGTTIKFNPPTGQDTMLKSGVSTNINTRHQCITAMKEYESKSLEELRMEDYLANRKGPQAGTTGLFATPQSTQAQTTFTFGTQNKTTGFGGFGQTTSSGTSLFGQPSQSGGLFGSAGNKTFGTTTTASTGFGGFGGSTSMFGQNTANKSLFGQPTTTQSSGLFGSTQTGTSSFGGFGGTQTGFGTSTTGGLFGSKPTSFAQPTTNTGLTFGQQNTLSSGGLFGNKSTGQTGTGLTFGQSSTTGFGFGTGTNTLGGKGFGQTSTSLGGGFGTGLFSGTQNKSGLGGIGTGFGFNLNNPGLTQNTSNTATLGQTGQQNQDAEILEQLRKTLIYSPYGDSPLFRNLENDTVSREDLLKPTNPIAQKAALSSQHQYKVSPTSTARIKPKPLTFTSDKSQLFDGLEDEDLIFGNGTFIPRRSIKKLNIKGNSSFSKQGSHLDMTELDASQAKSSPQKTDSQQTDREHAFSASKTTSDGEESPTSDSLPSVHEKRPHLGLFQNISGSFLDDTISELNSDGKYNTSSENKNENENSGSNTVANNKDGEQPESHPTGIVLRRHGYYTVPSLDELTDMIDSDGNCIVDDFVIGRDGYGSVMFPGKTNVANLNLDDIVHFRRKEITVYPVDEEKPPEGTGLNKKAQITLVCVWPCDKNTREYITDPERLKEMHYQEKLEQITSKKLGARFLDYRPETGSWVFEVKHFSKYGLIEGDDDDDDELASLDPKKLAKLKEDQQKQLAVQKQPIKVIPAQKPPVQGQDNKVLQNEIQQMDKQNAEPKNVESVPHLYPLLNDEEIKVDLLKETEPKEFLEMDEVDTLSKSPASHQLASQLGVMAADLQLRKASFFGDDDFAPTWKDSMIHQHKSAKWTIGQSLLSTAYSKSPQKSLAPHSFVTPFDELFSAGKSPDAPIWESAPVQARSIKKTLPLVPSGLKRKIPPLNNSLLQNKQHLLMDLGLTHGKQFRIGWAPHWNLVHGGQALSECSKSEESEVQFAEPQKFILLQEKEHVERFKLGSDDQRLLIEQLIVSPLQETGDYTCLLHQSIIDHLTIQLQHTQISVESGCPQAVPSLGNSILKPLMTCVENALKNMEGSADHHLYQQASLVWKLCHALWGNIDDLPDEDVKPDSYTYQTARREAVSEWLEDAVSGMINKEIEKIKAVGGNEALVIFQHLTGHQLEEACDVAQQNGNHQMALLISQASGMEDRRDYMHHQLIIWQQSELDQFIKPQILKIYALLAGTMVWRTSDGSVINVCEGLDWKRAMAVHLWYQCQPTCTVSEALKSYTEGFRSGCYAAPPLPTYLEAALATEDKQDVCYQLIQLFCDRSHPLHLLLSPTSAIPNHLDYRISWQLSQVLQALEFTHLSEYHSAMLCTNFAAQLESMGLWQWAVFVLMHISDHRDRKHAILQLLQRHVSLHTEEGNKDQETFLQNVLQIPSQWIHEAKAIRAGYSNEKEEEAWHWLKAGEWNKAHQLILNHLASKAIVNENFTDLKCLLSELGSPEISCTIEDWDTGGRVFLDYITMIETLQQLQQSEPSANELDKLQSEVCQLSRCIRRMNCHSATDRLCQSEMAKRAANLMRTLLQMKTGGDDINVMLVAETTDLPLPEDYALQELHQLTRCYMIGVTMA